VPFLSDGQFKIEDDDFGYGGNIGILVEPRDGTRFGLTYRSETNEIHFFAFNINWKF